MQIILDSGQVLYYARNLNPASHKLDSEDIIFYCILRLWKDDKPRSKRQIHRIIREAARQRARWSDVSGFAFVLSHWKQFLSRGVEGGWIEMIAPREQ
jgi:hypothetical protein